MRKPLAEAAQIMGCNERDLAFVEAVVCRSKTSFASGMCILSPERRYGMYALYSFCRIVDDIADEAGDIPTKYSGLKTCRNNIDRVYLGQAEGPIETVLAATVKRFDLKKEDFYAIIDGMEMDVEHPIVAPDEATLDIYCDRVASAVGRLAVRIFGDASVNAEKVAYHLGRALQLTNILRDIQEDAQRGRLYLPKELLQRFHLPLNPQSSIVSPDIENVCNIIAYRALDHFNLAKKYIALCDQKAIRPAKIMAVTYALLLKKQCKFGWKQPFERASLSPVQKIIVGIIGFMV